MKVAIQIIKTYLKIIERRKLTAKSEKKWVKKLTTKFFS